MNKPVNDTRLNYRIIPERRITLCGDCTSFSNLVQLKCGVDHTRISLRAPKSNIFSPFFFCFVVLTVKMSFPPIRLAHSFEIKTVYGAGIWGMCLVCPLVDTSWHVFASMPNAAASSLQECLCLIKSPSCSSLPLYNYKILQMQYKPWSYECLEG